MKKLLLLLLSLCLFSCVSTNQLENKVAADYGYTETTAILVGGEDYTDGPIYERAYLDKLTGPNGEEISYTRTGSCCQFETENGIMGAGLLDIYEVSYEGLEEPLILYLNMYDPNPGATVAPRGLKLKS